MLSVSVIAIYFAILAFLTVFGLHRYFLVSLFRKNLKNQSKPAPLPENLPAVTLQLPVYNEKFVVERLIRATCAIEYPKNKLQVQILDDSIDETTQIAQKVAEELISEGYDIEFIHRTVREGFKAGALEIGLRTAKGELIAIFDADFIPDKNFLNDTVGHFSDSSIGMVQVRWSYFNEKYSLFTRLQAMFLDGHFVVEHAARNWSGRFFNFNGTAGIWRAQAIQDAGGWEHDTLTEDLDLSYRAQLKGWKFIYLLDTTSESELPVVMNDYKTQQYRWAKGSIETAKKLLPRIRRAKIPFIVKTEAMFHMGGNIAYLLLLALSFMTLPALVVRIHMGWESIAVVDFAVFIAAFVPVSFFYVFAREKAGKGWLSGLFLLPSLLSLGIGISANNALAVWDGLRGKKSAFIRTPKYKVEGNKKISLPTSYGTAQGRTVLLELFLTVYCLQAVIFAIYYKIYFSVPFLVLFVFGFGYASALSIFHGFVLNRSGRKAIDIPQID